jgi:hypothetical protein
MIGPILGQKMGWVDLDQTYLFFLVWVGPGPTTWVGLTWVQPIPYMLIIINSYMQNKLVLHVAIGFDTGGRILDARGVTGWSCLRDCCEAYGGGTAGSQCCCCCWW